MNILILGGDGFCGWPTALHLSEQEHRVLIVDNFARRCIDVELGTSSLTPIQPMATRLAAWREVSGRHIDFCALDLAREYDRLLALLRDFRPAAIVHFAEQRAAPYSMKGSAQKRYTLDNNLAATHNVLASLVESGLDCHLVHLGTMGVYGYEGDGGTLPEGYLPVEIATPGGERRQRDILYPANPGSLYHLTKCLDQLLFQFYARNDGLKITDLHQGIVWGTQTDETRRDPRLINRFDYDGDFGTVLNRFLLQAAIGHPLTVYGTGGQTRAFINIADSVRCIRLAIEQGPPAKVSHDRPVRIINQMTEVHRVRDLAKLVGQLTQTPITFLDNPRREKVENSLSVRNDSLLDLGLEPITLAAGLLTESIAIARRFADRFDRSKIDCTSRWTTPAAAARRSDAGRADSDPMNALRDAARNPIRAA